MRLSLASVSFCYVRFHQWLSVHSLSAPTHTTRKSSYSSDLCSNSLSSTASTSKTLSTIYLIYLSTPCITLPTLPRYSTHEMDLRAGRITGHACFLHLDKQKKSLKEQKRNLASPRNNMSAPQLNNAIQTWRIARVNFQVLTDNYKASLPQEDSNIRKCDFLEELEDTFEN